MGERFKPYSEGKKKAIIVGATIAMGGMGFAEHRADREAIASARAAVEQSMFAGGESPEARKFFESYAQGKISQVVYTMVQEQHDTDARTAMMEELLVEQPKNAEIMVDFFGRLGKETAPHMIADFKKDPEVQRYMNYAIDADGGKWREGEHGLTVLETLDEKAGNIDQYSPEFVEKARRELLTQLILESRFDNAMITRFFWEMNKKWKQMIDRKIDADVLLREMTRRNQRHAIHDKGVAYMVEAYGKNSLHTYDNFRDAENFEQAIDEDLDVLERLAQLEEGAPDHERGAAARSIAFFVGRLAEFVDESEISLTPEQNRRLIALEDRFDEPAY